MRQGSGAARARVANEDEDDDDDDIMPYGYRSGRRTAEGIFPKVTDPIEAGVKLERSGLFGSVSCWPLDCVCY